LRLLRVHRDAVLLGAAGHVAPLAALGRFDLRRGNKGRRRRASGCCGQRGHSDQVASGREATGSLEQRRGVAAKSADALAQHSFDEVGSLNVVTHFANRAGLIVVGPRSRSPARRLAGCSQDRRIRERFVRSGLI